MFVIENANSLNGLSDRVNEILGKLDHLFFLTGSRFFGTHTENSDFDFFAHYNIGLIVSLESFGFSRVTDPHSLSMSYINAEQGIVTVFVLDNCHIQLVKDVEQKKEIQKILKGNLHLIKDLLTNKKQAKMLWSFTYNVYNSRQYAIWYKLKFEMKCSLCGKKNCAYEECPIVS